MVADTSNWVYFIPKSTCICFGYEIRCFLVDRLTKNSSNNAHAVLTFLHYICITSSSSSIMSAKCQKQEAIAVAA